MRFEFEKSMMDALPVVPVFHAVNMDHKCPHRHCSEKTQKYMLAICAAFVNALKTRAYIQNSSINAVQNYVRLDDLLESFNTDESLNGL